jgi:hypothetical protein
VLGLGLEGCSQDFSGGFIFSLLFFNRAAETLLSNIFAAGFV